MTRIFFTHILPEGLIRKHGLSFAACNFSFNLMSGGGFDKVYSTMGTYIGGQMDTEEYLDDRFDLVYNQGLRSMGKIGRMLANLSEQWTIFRKIPKVSSIWLYNISTLNVFLYILLRLFKRSVLVNVIELDFTPPTKAFSKPRLFLRMLNNAHGVIKLADSPLFTNGNSVCLAGVTPKEDCTAPMIVEPKMDFLLSGELQPEISSIPIILDAFVQVPECNLHITGQWCDMELMNGYTSKYPNIKYHGVLSFDEYLDMLHSVTFQLSLRNPDWGDNSCNFPSKVIEALLHNRIVISTIRYNQIDGIEYFESFRSVDSFVEILKKLQKLDSSVLMKYANQGQNVADRFSTAVWNYWMTTIENRKLQ